MFGQENISDRLGWHHVMMSLATWPLLLYTTTDVWKFKPMLTRDLDDRLYSKFAYFLTKVGFDGDDIDDDPDVLVPGAVQSARQGRGVPLPDSTCLSPHWSPLPGHCGSQLILHLPGLHHALPALLTAPGHHTLQPPRLQTHRHHHHWRGHHLPGPGLPLPDTQ